MGTVFAEITLKNGSDLILAQNGHINDQNIRSLTVNALVDTGAITLVINEDIRQKLGLAIEGTRTASLADGGKIDCKVTEPLRIYWKERDATCRAWVLPQSDDVLLGVIPLEEMDLIVDPANRKLVGAHGDEIVGLIK
jgi:clan AA aspartic protease